MAEQQAPTGPDLSQGVAAGDFTETLLGHVGDQEVLLVRSGREIFAIDAHCSHYHGPLRRGSSSEAASAVPGTMPASICAPGRRSRAPALSPIAVWQVEQRERPHLRPAKARAAEAGDVRGRAGAPGQDRHRRRRRGGFCRGRDAAAAAISRQHRHAEQRRRGAGRSAQSVEGLSCRQRAGRLDAAAPDSFYAETGIDLRLDSAVSCDRHGRAPGQPRRRRRRPLRSPAAGDGRRAGAVADSGRRPAACPYPADAGRLPGDHRRRRRRAPRDRDRRKFYWAGGRGRVACARDRGPRRGAGAAADGARARARYGRFRSRACTRSMASSFISAIPWPRSTASARRSRAVACSRPISSWSASACGRA